MRRKQLFDNEYYNSLLQNEIDKIADANGKNVVINITIPQQKEFMTVQDVADMLGVRKRTVYSMISRKMFKEGVHFTKTTGQLIFFYKALKDLYTPEYYKYAQ